MIRKLILSLSLLLLFATSCKTPPVSKSDVNSQMICQDTLLFLASVQKLQDQSQFADSTALQAQFDVVRKNFTNLRGAVSTLDDAKADDFNAAVQNLTDTADSLPDNVSVSDALKTLKDPIEQVVTATKEMQTGLNCIVQP
jgi:hypothetical protein